jgi:hypothetical protein
LPSPDLAVSLAEPDGLAVGVAAPMTLTVTNSGLPGVIASTSGGQVAVTLPAGLALVAPPSGCTATGTAGFSCPLAALDPGASAVFDFQVMAAAPLSNVQATATVSGVPAEVDLSNNSFTLSGISTTNGAPDLAVALSGATDLAVRVPSQVTLTVSNSDLPGVTASLGGAQVSATIPADLQLVVDADHPLPAGCTASGQTLTCDVGALNPGANQAFPFYVMAPEPILVDTAIAATVSGGGNDMDTANNTTALGDIVSTGSPDLSVALAGAQVLPVNTPSPMTLAVSNSAAPGVATATNGQVTVTLPAGLTLVDGSLPDGCTATSASSFSCTVANLAPGADTDFGFEVVASGAGISGAITASTSWDVAGQGATEPVSSNLLDVSVASAGVQDVPALSDLALALLALTLAAAAVAALRRKG